MNKKTLGQFYTKNASYITEGLLSIFDCDKIVVDPFAGECDLVKLIKNKTELYDIDSKLSSVKKRDSLLDPVDYSGKLVFTNPPFLSKNKNKNKTIYTLYNTDDLYKSSLLSIIGCDGGVIILPINFFSGNDRAIREQFLSKYKVTRVNVFEETVFNDTSYTVCSFSFIKEENSEQTIPFVFYPSKEKKEINLFKSSGYTIFPELYKKNKKIKRLLIGDSYPSSKVFLHAIDTGSEEGKIKLSIKDSPFFGKSTDRAFATIIFDRDLSLEEQKKVVDLFNYKLNCFREEYHSLFLSNYRNSTKFMARKRIGFDLAYSIIGSVIEELGI